MTSCEAGVRKGRRRPTVATSSHHLVRRCGRSLLTGMLFLMLAMFAPLSCSGRVPGNQGDHVENGQRSTMISEDQARRIAAQEAARYYRDLDIYEVTARLVDGVWHVDYELADPGMVGGGPHYRISAETGEILSYRYEQ